MRNEFIQKSLNSNPIYIYDNPESMSFKLAQKIVALLNKYITENGRVTFQVSSGGSPKILYEFLTSYFKSQVDWKKVVLIQMDEYLGIELSHPGSQYAFLKTALLDKIEFGEQIIFDKWLMENPAAYEDKIDLLGGIDISIQGIGENGHLAFNEPGTPINSATRKVDLHENTRIANSRFFARLDEVPTMGITCGLNSILKAKHIFLLSIGPKKAEAIKKAIIDPISLDVPASALRSRNEVNYYLDTESALFIESKL